MPLGMKIGVGPGNIVLDGDPTPPEMGHSPPQFSAHVCCGQTAGLIKMPLATELASAKGQCVRWGPSSPPKGAQPPIFGPIVAKWSPISATAEHLLLHF